MIKVAMVSLGCAKNLVNSEQMLSALDEAGYMIVDVDMENKCLLVSGNVPGPKNSFVFIKEAIKGNKYNETVELVSYEEVVESESENNETVSENVVENNAITEEVVAEEEINESEEVQE